MMCHCLCSLFCLGQKTIAILKAVIGVAAKIVFTTTASLEPIIYAIPESKNSAIIGLGSDDEHKSEISPQLFKTADIVIVDNKL